MARTVHVIGNGDCASYYQLEPRKGLKLCCNVPPFEIYDMYATCIVDFKMMQTIHAGQVNPPGEWICGIRPKMYCEQHPAFHMKIANRIKQFYTEKPKYAKNYTDFNCGHFATYFAAKQLKAERIHLWGFDSIFDFNLRSFTDLVLNSDRGNMNNRDSQITGGLYGQTCSRTLMKRSLYYIINMMPLRLTLVICKN